jgi:hypothetical protein
MRKLPGHIVWVTALYFILCNEDPLKLYKKEFATRSEKRCLNDWLKNNVFFLTKNYALYIEVKTDLRPRNGHATQKSPGNVICHPNRLIIIFKDRLIIIFKYIYGSTYH